tara:strand:- start:33 stop:368 length:336 start_codon:yes stop_codon:yes gene_type:complete
MLNPMNLLGGGGGPSVNANVQAGKTNSQTIGTTNNTDQEVSVQTLEGNLNQSNDKNKVSTENVGNININEIPPWVLILLVLGWLAPSPQEMGRGLLTLIATLRRKKDGSTT